MNTDLSLRQATALLDYLKNSSGGDREQASNTEVLSGLVLLFCRMYLELIIEEMKARP